MECQGPPRDSLRLDAENKARRVVLVARDAAREMVWELQLDHRDGPQRELMEVRPLAQREHRVSMPLGRLAQLRPLDEQLREPERRARLAAARQPA